MVYSYQNLSLIVMYISGGRTIASNEDAMRKIVVVICLILNYCVVSRGGLPRKKRYLIYPKNGSKVQLIAGTGVPVPVENQAVTIGWVVKSAYLVPTNSTEITDGYVTFQKRSNRHRASRYDFYRSLQHATENFGIGGKECVLQAICEASKVPLKASSLAGQILHVFLTPSSTDESPITRSDMDYHNAEKLGKEPLVDCGALYSGCQFSIIDILTVIS